MTGKKSEKAKLLAAAVIFAAAGAGLFRFYKNSNPPEGKAWFYDLGAKKLFTAPHGSVPPIKGIAGGEDDGVRAVVITTSGNCADEKSRKIAYLETYSPELKFQVELRKSNNPQLAENQPSIRRGEAHGFILVKRPEDAEWHSMTSNEGQQIVNSASLPGLDGKTPVVCVP